MADEHRTGGPAQPPRSNPPLRQLVVLSGKGGTGKTTVTAALAHLASQHLSVVLADADVDAANLELVLAPALREEQDFWGGRVALIDAEKCALCGICAEVCRFDAVVAGDAVYRIDALACEGCASCVYQCPESAVRMEERQAGRWFRSDTRFGPLFHAHLFAGQENSGKLVTLVKQRARLRALDAGANLLLVDGPPGIGCPVISAIAGADLVLLVVEPTISGAHDLERAVSVAAHFGVPSSVLVNKADLSHARSEQIVGFCKERGIQVLGRIPYDDIVTEAMVQGLPVTEHTSGPVTRALEEAWLRIRIRLLQDRPDLDAGAPR
jgi:MinD superfamily P-loop ATPase